MIWIFTWNSKKKRGDLSKTWPIFHHDTQFCNCVILPRIFAKGLMIKRVNNLVGRWAIVSLSQAQLSYFSRGFEMESKNGDIQGANCGIYIYMFNECTGKISRVNQNTSRLLVSAMASSLSRFLYLSHLKTLLATLLASPRISHELYRTLVKLDGRYILGME